jgi:hypothetical protein
VDAIRDDDPVRAFVIELVKSGSMLSELLVSLASSLPVGAYPGEDSRDVVMDMIGGTIETALGDADPGEVRRATELISQAADRTMEHLRLALALSRRLHGDEADGGRRYG